MKKGFTLIELLIVMSVVAILVSIIVPSFRAMQQEAWLAKAEKEVQALQVAVESFFRHQQALPSNLTTDLLGASPRLIVQKIPDPFNTDALNQTYGYEAKNIGNSAYYVIYSQGLNGHKNWSWAEDGSAKIVLESGSDDIIQTNAVLERS